MTPSKRAENGRCCFFSRFKGHEVMPTLMQSGPHTEGQTAVMRFSPASVSLFLLSVPCVNCSAWLFEGPRRLLECGGCCNLI